MVVHPSVPAKTVPEFITYAKANPGKITMASGGNGSPSHVSGRGRRISGETAQLVAGDEAGKKPVVIAFDCSSLRCVSSIRSF